MPIIFDFKCEKCGKLEQDYLLDNSKSPPPTCSICGEPMEKLFTGMYTVHGIKHHNALPKEYKLSRGGVNFGKLNDL